MADIFNPIIPLIIIFAHMKWKQDLEIKRQPIIDHDSSVLSIGSCFSNNIGQYLESRYMDALVNPLGILFNPVSIQMMVTRALKIKPYSEKDVTHHLGIDHLVSLHGSCQHYDQQKLLENVNTKQEKLREYLLKSDILLLTFGTAIVFQYLPGGFVAGNNHKLPIEHFEKQTLTVNETKNSILQTIREVRKHNPALKIILTVSPVRHLRNGSVQNQLSKSTLLVAVHSAISEFNDVHYFPAYEILMDELRDYRFYKEDLVHPSEEAIRYIWERFTETHFTSKASLFLKDIDQLNAMINHRPLFPESNEHQQFLYKLNTFKKQVMSQWNINLPDEITG